VVSPTVESQNTAPGTATGTAVPRLQRALPGMPPPPPVRIVHLGIGNFARAHPAWYTARAGDAANWGIAAFTGRRADVADALGPQDGLYTLVTRHADGDRFEVLGQLAAVHPASEHAAFLDYFGRPEVALVTITVTEAAYLLASGRLDADNAVVRTDVAALTSDPEAPVDSLPAKLVAGLLARRRSGAGPLTIVSCDNLPENGAATAAVVTDLARLVDPSLVGWVEQTVDFATSVVDRITPGTTEEDKAAVQEAQGYLDAAPVATEPYSEWVVAGRFPAGRPAWEDAGVRVVDDVTPYEQRKLRLLNGSHSLLAYGGSLRGHVTIDEAIGDPECRAWVETFWDECCRHLELPAETLTAYREALLDRFSNPRMRDVLKRIAADGSTKLVVRTVPTLRAERAEGRLPTGCATAIAAWIWHLRGHGAPVKDAGAAAAARAAASDDERAAVAGVLETLAPELAGDDDLLDLIENRVRELRP
jgi:fructuronate reductase